MAEAGWNMSSTVLVAQALTSSCVTAVVSSYRVIDFDGVVVVSCNNTHLNVPRSLSYRAVLLLLLRLRDFYRVPGLWSLEKFHFPLSCEICVWGLQHCEISNYYKGWKSKPSMSVRSLEDFWPLSLLLSDNLQRKSDSRVIKLQSLMFPNSSTLTFREIEYSSI